MLRINEAWSNSQYSIHDDRLFYVIQYRERLLLFHFSRRNRIQLHHCCEQYLRKLNCKIYYSCHHILGLQKESRIILGIFHHNDFYWVGKIVQALWFPNGVHNHIQINWGRKWRHREYDKLLQMGALNNRNFQFRYCYLPHDSS